MNFWTTKNEIILGRVAMIAIMVAIFSELMTNTLAFNLL